MSASILTLRHRPASARRVMVPGEASRRTGLALVAIGLALAFGLAYDNFLTGDNAKAIALNSSSLAIAVIGSAALVISGHVDLSIGSMYALCSVVAAQVAVSLGDPVTGIAAGILAGVFLGAVNGVLVRLLKISPLIVTLGTLALFRGLAFVAGGGDGASIYGLPEGFTDFGTAEVLGLKLPIVLAILACAAGSFMLVRTVVGLHVYALGGDAEASRRSGIRGWRLVVGLYAFNGALVGLAAVLTTARIGSGAPQLGQEFELDVLTAVILGGVAFAGGSGHPLGIVTGVATIGILNAGLVFMGLADFYQQLAKGLVLLLALAADQYALHRREKRALAVPVAPPGSPSTASSSSTRSPRTQPPRSTPDRQPGEVILECEELSKRYGSVLALSDASFRVRAGEVVCIVGDNGAGKSTLIKIVTGAVKPDSGAVRVDGKHATLATPADALSMGIEAVYQDLAICPNLGVAHNLTLGDEPTRRSFGFLRVRDDRQAVVVARERLERLGIQLANYHQPARLLSGGQRQSVAIARALTDHTRILVLDEPTAALGVKQTERVLQLTNTIANSGVGVIFISHDVRTVKRVADRVIVLRLGGIIADVPVNEISEGELLDLMSGPMPSDEPPESASTMRADSQMTTRQSR